MANREVSRPELPFSMNVYAGRGRSAGGRRLGTFVVGLAAGAVALANWRTILRRGLPLGLRLRTAMVRSAEDLADMVKEAQAEYAATTEAPTDTPRSR